MPQHRYGFRFVCAFIVSVLSSTTANALDVSGKVMTQTWTAINSPYCVTDTVTVPSGETLTIEEGVDVLFDAEVPFVVNGSLRVVGTLQDSVRFLPGLAPTWGGLRFISETTNDVSRLDCARISGANAPYGGGVYLEGMHTSVELKHCTVSENSATYGGGISSTDNASLTLSICTISGNSADIGGGLQSRDSASAELVDCVISGNHAFEGGGIFSTNEATTIATNCAITSNTADYSGGGIANTYSAVATLLNCEIAGNTADYVGSGVLNSQHASISLTNCVIADNIAEFGNGGGIANSENSTATLADCVVSGNIARIGGGLHSSASSVELTRCAIVGNTASVTATIYAGLASTMTFVNCTVGGNEGSGIEGYEESDFILLNTILWGNSPVNTSTTTALRMLANYSNIGLSSGVLVPGVGNMNADPIFIDPDGGDYSLAEGSPCINAGSPSSPLDLDGTRADIGAFPFDHSSLVPQLSLPEIDAPAGLIARIPILGTMVGASSARLAFLVDASVVVPDERFIRATAFDESDGVLSDWAVNGDTVTVTLAATTPVTLVDDLLVELGFFVLGDAPPTTISLTWLPYPDTDIDETGAVMTDGTLTVYEVPGLYGDVTGDGTISALDASTVLRYVVGKINEINIAAADVTGNGVVSAYDASHILSKVVNPSFIFPVEGGMLAKASTASALAWSAGPDGWAFRSYGSGPIGADITLRLPDGASVSSNEAFAYSRDGELVTISVATLENDAELFRVNGTTAPPSVVSASINEQNVSVATPVSFALAQNAPNPFNPQTTLRFGIPEAGAVCLAIYDVNGRLVRTLVDGAVAAGMHEIVWDARDDVGRAVASGVYVYRLNAGADVAVRRMVLVR